MEDNFLKRPINIVIGLYLMIVIGNTTTGIINEAIDKVIPEVDNATAALLGIIRFISNFDGVLILSIVGILSWLLFQWKKSDN